MRNWNTKRYIFGLLSLLTIDACLAQSLKEKGMAIMVEAENRDSGWKNSSTNVTMILRNNDGATQNRKLRVKDLEVKGDGDKNLIVFDEPKDIRGSALLTFTYKLEDDDQWLYLPVISRVKKIASRNKSGPFMGSEFAFEDLSSQEIEKFTYEYIKDAPCGDGLECFVVKRFPVDKYSGYSSQNVWLDKAEYRIQTIEIYDRKRDLLKTFTASDQKRFEGNFWRSMTQKMVNHQNGKSTDLIFSNYEFNLDIKDSDFTKNGLKRLR